MTIQRTETLPIHSSQDIVMVRQRVRFLALEIKLGLVDQTKVVTAASELARNTLDYGRGGQVCLEVLDDGSRKGLRMIFTDQGPGIADIGLALSDGYTSGGGLGMGLGGSKRLVSELHVESQVGKGTCVTATKWK